MGLHRFRAILSLLTLLGVMSACRLSQLPSSTTPRPGTAGGDSTSRGRIAIVRLDGNIAVVDPSGVAPTSITVDAHDDRPASADFLLYESPTWNAATGDLAFIGIHHSGERGQEGRVHVASPDGSQDDIWYSSTTEFPFYLFWSPTGRELTFLASSQESEPLGLWRASGDVEAELLDRGQPYYWDWDPTGSRLLSHVGGSTALNPGQAHLSVVEGTDVAAVGVELQVLSFQAPAYSPDGRHLLAVVQQGASDGGLAMLNGKGEVAAILSPQRGPMAFEWSAGGEHVAFVAGRSIGGNLVGDLTVLDVTQPADPQRIETGAHGVLAFWWSSVGERLAYLVAEPVQDSPDQLILDGRRQAGPMLGLNLFDAATGRTSLMARLRPTGDLLRILPFYDQYQRSARFWSPDGTEFVYASEGPGGDPGVWVASTGGAPPRQIGQGTFGVWSWK